MGIYLDNSAIQKPKKEVIDTVINVLNNNWYNGSSVYEKGLESKQIIQYTKEVIAKEINCTPEEIVLVSSGSEANSLAIDGWIRGNKFYQKDYFVCSTIEHSSILKNPKARPIIFCDEQGFYKINWIKEIHDSLVSLQMANSEIGTIQNIKEITKILHENNCVVHSDAVAVFGKIPINVKELGVDMLSATGQKIGSICGAAFLYVKKGTRLESIIYGSQEKGLRGGSYNVPAIAGLSKAVELISYEEEKEVKKKRDYLLEKLLSIDGVMLNGTSDMKYRLPNNINICVKNTQLNAQQMIAMLDLLGGYCVSAGSACNAGNSEPSHVLLNIGMSEKDALRSIRITLSNDNTYEELDKFYNDFSNIIQQYKK